jgi:O-antigen ligase/polysaccharide polymerase Wzy-like membrane protein
MKHPWGKAYAVLFGLSLFGFPVVSAIPVVLSVDSRGISMGYRALVATLSLYVLMHAAYRRCPRISGPSAAAFVAVVAILFFRMLWDSVFTRLPLDLPWQDLWLFAGAVTLLPAIVFCFVPTNETLDGCLRSALVIGAGALIAIVVSVAASVQDLSKLERLATSVLNPVSVGHAGTSLVIVCLSRVAAGTGPKGSRIGAAARVVLGIAGVLMTVASASKGPILALVVAVLLTIVLRGDWDNSRRRLVRRAVWSVIALIVMAAAFYVVTEFTTFQTLQRFSDLSSDTSTMIRTRLMTDALVQSGESPIVGSAMVEYNEFTYPHNIAVESLLVGGAVGLATLLAFLSFVSVAAFRICRQLPHRRWLVVLLVQYLIDSMFSGSLYLSGQFWTTCLIVISAARPLELAPSGETLGTPLQRSFT